MWGVAVADLGTSTPWSTHEMGRYHVENLVWALFGRTSYPIFDMGGMAVGRVDEFVSSKETFDATLTYIKALHRIYLQKNPGHQLHFAGITRKVVFDELSSNTVRNTPMKSASSAHDDKNATTTDTGAGSSASQVQIEQISIVDSGQRPVAQPSVPISPQAIEAEQTQASLAPPSTATVTPRVLPAEPATPLGSAPFNSTLEPGQIPQTGSVPKKPLLPKATFRIPNAKVGVPYSGKLEGKDQSGCTVQVRNPLIRTSLGLSYDEASGELRGVPLTDGEQRISLQWSTDGVGWFTGECLFFINPDPRSLWKNIEPPADDPYYKPNFDSTTIKSPSYSIIAASRRGRSHEHSGTFRDDDFFVMHDPVANWSIVVVADGAGSAKSSRRGSKLAVDAFGEHVKAQLSGDQGRKLAGDLAGWAADPEAASKAMGTDFHYLFHKAGTIAVQAIESEAQSKNAPIKEYSTTLLAAAVRPDGDGIFLSTFWMGDGAIAVYGPRGKVRLMGTPDGGEFAGQTRFLDRAALSDPSFAKRIGIGRYSELNAIMLMTDGVSDPRFETDAGLVNSNLWDQLWDELLPLMKSENPDKALVEWLHFFTPGHHDDRTIAILAPTLMSESGPPPQVVGEYR